jgi:hypothetical protein
MPEALSDCVQEEVRFRLDQGASVAEVQKQLIDGAPGLNEEERAALWLFAWSYRATARGGAGREPGRVAG